MPDVESAKQPCPCNANITATYQTWRRNSTLASLSCQTHVRTHNHHPSYKDHAANVYRQLLALL